MPDASARARYAARDREHKRRVGEAARRREAVVLLRITAATADYAAAQLGNGLSPEAARVAAVEVAEELEAAAGSLRRLTRLGPAERRALAVELAEAGMSQREIAGRLGLSLRAVWGYLRHSTAVETP